MSRIQTYTISADALVTITGAEGEGPSYKSIPQEPSITPDSQGKWCLYDDHLESLVAIGDEMALLRLELADNKNTIEDLRAEVKSLNRMIDTLTAEF